MKAPDRLLEGIEERLYDLVAIQFLASVMGTCRLRHVDATILVGVRPQFFSTMSDLTHHHRSASLA